MLKVRDLLVSRVPIQALKSIEDNEIMIAIILILKENFLSKWDTHILICVLHILESHFMFTIKFQSVKVSLAVWWRSWNTENNL